MTDIRAPRQGARRRELIVDGEAFRATSLDVIRALGIVVGTIMPAEELARLLDDAEPRVARERALRLLGYRDRSSSDLRSRLVDDGFPDRVAADAVADLSRASLVDDGRYAANAARNLTTVRGFGRTRAQRVLVSQGVDPEAAAAAVTEALPDAAQEEAALELARALARRPNASVERVAVRLARRGYPHSLAFRLASQACEESAGGPGTEASEDTPFPDLPLPGE